MSSCNTGAKQIDYGNDGCHFCKMTIVDKIHGAELITNTGKVFKFDATECMLNYTNEKKNLAVESMLTNYYESPTKFISAKEAIFLISENLPSPMRENITAFKSKESSEKIIAEKGGKLFTYEALKAHLKQ